MADVRVVKVEGRAGKPFKDPIYGYRYPVLFTIEDGRTFKGFETARLLRDVKTAVAKLPEEPVNCFVILRDGEFAGSVRKFSFGIGGLVADGSF